MKVSRACAFLLALFTAGLCLLSWLQEELDLISVALLGMSASVLAVGAAGRSIRKRSRQLIAAAATIYTLGILSTLAFQFDGGASLPVRFALAALLLLGALLSLRCLHQINRSGRYGFQNYYDTPGPR
jgi:peptidoglycan/LPS O-acetylase OafA/YrhL